MIIEVKWNDYHGFLDYRIKNLSIKKSMQCNKEGCKVNSNDQIKLLAPRFDKKLVLFVKQKKMGSGCYHTLELNIVEVTEGKLNLGTLKSSM